MAVPFERQVNNLDQVITAAQVDHLPIIAHYARRLGLVEMINGLVPVEMEVEPGMITLGLVLDTLSGRSPLYHLENAFENGDRELLFGQPISHPDTSATTMRVGYWTIFLKSERKRSSPRYRFGPCSASPCRPSTCISIRPR